MSKILIISDIHIYDYPQRNPSNRYRLHQSRTIAQNIIEAGRENGCDILVIAGDVIEKFDAKPYVLAETKLFLDTLMANFKVGYIIWGNHDMDNKSSDSEFIDSALSVMLPPNLYYADKQEITVDGCRIGFSNYRSEFDLSWINGQLDLLITHATISYSEGDHIHSQKLDESKFKLAICGDIHRPATTGKYVSIGIPQKCKMGDFDEASGIVFDCTTKDYAWVNLNPHDNLMKFVYTDDRNAEGWDEGTGTWKVYRPTNISVNSGITNIEIPAWTEIDNLVAGIISNSGLVDLHKKVLSDVKNRETEIDFNFTLKRLRCKNWRSIDEVELYFDEADKYLISGTNGSGKSSFLSALKYAFIDYPHYKEFIQFGTKECETEVEFIYQGNLCKILRGSKKYGCTINGTDLKYNNKNEFVQDMRDRFPFIEYLEDVCFFNSDHPRFIGGLKPERKSEIISKFYKIDKIDEYNRRAWELLEELKDGVSQWQQLIDRNEKLLVYISDKLQLLEVPQVPLEVLVDEKNKGLELNRKYMAYNNFMTKTATLQAQLEATSLALKELENKESGFRDKKLIQSEISEYQSKVSEIMNKYQELSSIIKKGKELCDHYKDLGKTKTCRSCGQVVTPGNDLEQHKKELYDEIQNMSKERDLVYKYFEENLDMNRDDVDSGRFQERVNQYNYSVASLMSEIKDIDNTRAEISQKTFSLNQINQSLMNIGEVPEKVDLPPGFMEYMGSLETQIQTWDTYNGYLKDRNEAEKVIEECRDKLDVIRRAQGELSDYIKLTGPTGQIYEEIMSKLATQFSDNKVTYKVEKWMYRKQEHLELASYFLNNGNEVSYSQCSDGQKTVLDIDFLGKVVTRTGIMVMDEFLKYLDGNNLDEGVESIKGMNVGCLFLSSHASGIPRFYNRSLTTTLNESGVTSINVV